MVVCEWEVIVGDRVKFKILHEEALPTREAVRALERLLKEKYSELRERRLIAIDIKRRKIQFE